MTATSAAVAHAPRPVRLREIAAATGGVLRGDGKRRVTGLRHDSRAIAPGDLFVARRGARHDGLAFVDAALRRGAVAVLTGQDRPVPAVPVPVIAVADVRGAMARAASLIYHDPTQRLPVVGITGTNGKTTTAYLVRSVLQSVGHRPGIMGTLGHHFAGASYESGFNTPEADELTRVAARMAAAGATHLIMEVTSHGIAERRVDGVRFEVAAFTNLTPDHLDLHGSMEAYAAAKARLFDELCPSWAALVIDDPLGAALAERRATPSLRVSRRATADAEVHPVAPLRVDRRGIRGTVTTPSGTVSIDSPLVGWHNVENLLLALAVLSALGVDGARAAAALGRAAAVPGRLERCDGKADDLVAIVDYAHSPDALRQALAAARLTGDGRLICVLGCGGDRDRTKRRAMGIVAGRQADRAIVTTDNPRSESPETIADAIVGGLAAERARYAVELDRAEAIGTAVASAAPGDVVLVAGKGHETVQIVGTAAHPFDDRAELRRALARRRAAGGDGDRLPHR